ncbi:MAG: serine hydrolase [Gemmatimonadales bacterium]|nr:serine hydrolase [Gemmatimonadales bacterium]NIN10852.1 serine hydrolase [Gemmatimonadales bacterium]NIR02860.1 serine hydrolase [Gemmatimonadales bacterium]NIS66494.1 serine hydrolase [Gemmatimonadales bacterium]
MKRTTVWFLYLALASPLLGQQGSLKDHPRVQEAIRLLEVWIDAQRAYESIPGISMAVVHDQELLWSGGFGHANRERQVPATPQTMYSICSISKLFTSIGVMQLLEQGKLRLDDPVATHLDWFNIQDTYPDAPPVTVQGILTHSSGLPRESDYPYWTEPDFSFPTREQIIERLSSQKELYPASTYFQYSNLGLTLAGEIVAQVSGRPFGDYIRQNILDPLGMDATNPEIPEQHHGGRLAVGYGAPTREGSRERLPAFQARGIAPAAGFASTVEDLAKFVSWQFRVLHHGADEVLGRNTLREMHRVHWLDPDWETTWGLGFAVWRSNDKTFVGHGGSCPGYRSHLSLQTDDKIAAIFMSNANGVNTSLHTQRAQEIFAPAIAAALDSTSEAKPADPTLEKYTGTYSGSPWGGELAVVTWKGNLAMLYLPTTNPIDGLAQLNQVGEHTFRRIRDDESLGEEIVFEVAEDGTVTRMWRHSNFTRKVR